MNWITWTILGVVVAVIGSSNDSFGIAIVGAILILYGITRIETSGMNYMYLIFGSAGSFILCSLIIGITTDFLTGGRYDGGIHMLVATLVGLGIFLSAASRIDAEKKGKSDRRRDAKVEAGTCDWCGAPLGGNYYECKVGYCSDVFCSQQCAMEHIRRMHPDER